MTSNDFIRSSFRDPDGRIFLLEDRVIRVIRKDAYGQLSLFLQTREANELLEKGQLVNTKI